MRPTMRAVRLEKWQAVPDLLEVGVPEAGPGDVLLRMTAAGLCHSDLHVMHSAPGQQAFDVPFTLGHEVTGIVVAAGSAVTTVTVGDDVAVYGIWACGRCDRCRSGRENYCTTRRSAVGCGLGADGGLAEFLVVPSERFLVPLRGLEPVIAAPLTDAGLTSYHALLRSRRHLSRAGLVVVIGAGGLGHLAIQLLRALSPATVLAVDQKAAACELALRCGAHDAVTHADDAVTTVRQLSRGTGADVVLDFVGAQSTLQLAGRLVAVDGDLTIIGSAGGTLTTGKTSGLPVACRVSAPFWGTCSELNEVLALAARGVLRPEVEVFRLSDALSAYERLKAGTVTGRAVVVPD